MIFITKFTKVMAPTFSRLANQKETGLWVCSVDIVYLILSMLFN